MNATSYSRYSRYSRLKSLAVLRTSRSLPFGKRDDHGNASLPRPDRIAVVSLANGWTESEVNVIGDGSRANFNAGTKLTVRIDLADGSTAKPVCKANDGTTGETNNLR